MNGYEKRKVDANIGLSFCKETRKLLGDNPVVRFRKAVLAASLTLFFTGSATAQEFKSSEFLTWNRDNQEFYIRTSMGMAGLIAGRNVESQGKCLDDWYFGNQDKANNEVLATMRRFPSYHPRGVIAAIMEKKCGSIVYTK